MTGRVQQRINLRDGHTLGTRSNLHDLLAGFDLTLLDDAKIKSPGLPCGTSSAAICGSFMNKPPLIDLDELPAFEQVCAAAGGYGERVEDPAALDRAVRAVTVEKRQALLNVICRGV